MVYRRSSPISSSDPRNKTRLEPDGTYRLFIIKGSPVSCWRTGFRAQAVGLPFSRVEVRSNQQVKCELSAWTKSSQSAVAATVVCISQPHLNQSLIINVWHCLGLGSLPFVLLRAFRPSNTSNLARLSRFLCRSQHHRATGEHTMPSCRTLARV